MVVISSRIAARNLVYSGKDFYPTGTLSLALEMTV
jgi:hypothetical protein